MTADDRARVIAEVIAILKNGKDGHPLGSHGQQHNHTLSWAIEKIEALPTPAPEAGCRYMTHAPGERCECEERIARVTTHTRTSTSGHGPDYCGECSSAISEWVPWPCPASAPDADEPIIVGVGSIVPYPAPAGEDATLTEVRKYLDQMDRTDSGTYPKDFRDGFRHALAMLAAYESDDDRAPVREAARLALDRHESTQRGAADLHTVLHELWLRIHIRRFDGNDYGDDPRPDYVTPQRVVPDCYYNGVLHSQFIVEAYAREHGIDRVYDRPKGEGEDGQTEG